MSVLSLEDISVLSFKDFSVQSFTDSVYSLETLPSHTDTDQSIIWRPPSISMPAMPARPARPSIVVKPFGFDFPKFDDLSPVSPRPNPMLNFKIESEGLKSTVSNKPNTSPVSILALKPGRLPQLTYISRRAQRSSQSCTLVSANDPTQTPLSNTTYRPGKGHKSKPWVQFGDEAEQFRINGMGMLTRTRCFKCRLGTFEWRYEDDKERWHILTGLQDGSCPLILERLEGNRRREVAKFMRQNEAKAGEGGKLAIDVGSLLQGGLGRAGPDGEDDFVVMVITTCLVMLKREVSRKENDTDGGCSGLMRALTVAAD